MPVSMQVRRVETEIDHSIAALQVWNTPRETLLRAILEYYRDEIELVFTRASVGLQLNDATELESGFGRERDLHAGVLQALKWAMELSSPYSEGASPNVEVVHEVIDLGWRYEVLVDALKMANHDRVAIAVDNATRTLTVYEGGDRTGVDAQLVAHQHRTLPLHAQVPLIADEDQLTTKWTAGDFRRVIGRLATVATNVESEEVVSTFGGRETSLFNRPVIFEIADAPEAAEQAVLEDLTLTADKVAGLNKWRLASWMDVPLVAVGLGRLAVSNIVKALAGLVRDDYMLRVAIRSDEKQYVQASELRANRMIDACRTCLEAYGWKVRPKWKLTDPDREVDIYATREERHLVLSLKSTLRPETPWEVLKRNEDVMKGISHTGETLHRFPEGAVGLVVTDGYRGDYTTWAAALARSVMIGTLEDMGDIAMDPTASLVLLTSRAGFDGNSQGSPIPDRELELAGWTLRLVDAPEQSHRTGDHGGP